MIAAIVPLKRLSDAKSRLAPSLAPDERRALALELLGRVVSALLDSGIIGRVAVVTPEERLPLSSNVTLLCHGGDLNVSLRHGITWAASHEAERALILPADLPLVRPEHIRALAAAALPPPSVTLVRTQDGGTGAIVLSPPDAIAPAFGPNSFNVHRAAALARGVDVLEPAIPALATDLDTLGDLNEMCLSGVFIGHGRADQRR